MEDIQLSNLPEVATLPDIETLVTEDDTPVDNLFSEKQQRLLTEPLYSTWEGPGMGRPFLAAANVGIFCQVRTPPIVPDVFLSLDVQIAEEWRRKEHRSYFVWEFGKLPEVVIEIVSKATGGEADYKLRLYTQMRVSYYVVYDPLQQLMSDTLTVCHFHGNAYVPQDTMPLPGVPLGLTLWEGVYEGKQDTWLRWTDDRGHLILTGKEQAAQAQQQAAQERLAREQMQQHLAEAEQQAARRAALLRQLGHDPDQA